MTESASSQEPAIKVTSVNKTFKLPHEKVTSVKNIFAHAIGYITKRRSFEIQQALKDISFEVKKGEFFGIVGRNGSGKSTLLKLLAGIYVPDSGEIVIDGRLTPFIELGVGFNMELTGRENVFLNGALLGFSRKEMQAMYQDIVDFAEIENFMDQKLKNYSSGMQVRLAFSIAIRAQSDILLIDEVLAVGDAAFQQKCFNYFEELKSQKKTVVFITHDMAAVRRFCTKAIYVKDSKLIKVGTPFEIADIYLEENMEVPQEANTDEGDSSKTASAYSVSTKIVNNTGNKILLEVSYSSNSKVKMYTGISIIKDGLSVAEINTLPDKDISGHGKIYYTLDTSIFNGGLYHITVALFKLSNRQLVCIGKNKSQFLIKGSDFTRGAALKLENTWEYKS